MKFKKIISAAVGAAMLCASLPIGTTVNLTDNVLKANAVDEPYSESEYPSESYYYGSGEATWEEASEEYSSEEYETEAPSDYPYWWGETTEPYEEDPSSYYETTEPYTEAEETTEQTWATTGNEIVVDSIFQHKKDKETVIEIGKIKASTGGAGEIVRVPVSISNSNGFTNTEIEYTFDNRLEAIGVYDGNAYPPNVSKSNGVISVSSSNTVMNTDDVDGYFNGKYQGSYLLKGSGTLYNLMFRLPYDVSDGDTFDISANIKQFIDSDGNNIETKIYDGSIATINYYKYGYENYVKPESINYEYTDTENNMDIVIGSAKILKGDAGKILKVPVEFSNNKGFANTKIKYSFDEKLKFLNVERNLIWSPSVSVGNDYVTISSKEASDITSDYAYSYYNSSLYYMYFKLPDTLSVGDMFNISAELLEFTNSAGEDINPKVFNAKVTVLDDEVLKPTNVTYNHSNDKETVIEVGNVKISKEDAGKIIEVPVSIFNNPGFAATLFGYKYDERIKYLRITANLIESSAAASGGNYEAVASGNRYDITSNGVLYYLSFRLPENIKPGDVYNISAEMNQFCSADGENVDAKIYGGSITIVGDTEPLKATVKTNELEVGKKTTIEANQNNLTYKTSDSSIAVVSKSGEITAISAGTVTITVINSDGETDVITITVKGLSLETTTPTENKSLGDINSDGKIDSKDAVIVLKSYAEKLAGNPTKDDTSAGDVNGDGEVDSKDAVIILRYYASVIAGVFKGNISEFI
ncbi:MAG: dockerin type I domain-containing protein [Oscillospiraceae bacterium]|nr:dockerin type I domain-containing protein [Oscillospiraceae bacterium]